LLDKNKNLISIELEGNILFVENFDEETKKVKLRTKYKNY